MHSGHSREIFRNRIDAGRRLAAALNHHAGRPDILVLGLPRGGVPVAWAVAQALGAPLDVLVVRKLGLPGWEELAMGALASGGICVLNDVLIAECGVSADALEEVKAKERIELERRELAFRGRTGLPDIAGRTVILVDDGIATGFTLRAAIQALRQRHPARLVVAAPVAAADTWEEIGNLADEAVALLVPQDFRAVGQWYEDFSQTTDEEVREILARAQTASPQ
jgi:predicted phosphoribosyltransferase